MSLGDIIHLARPTYHFRITCATGWPNSSDDLYDFEQSPSRDLLSSVFKTIAPVYAQVGIYVADHPMTLWKDPLVQDAASNRLRYLELRITLVSLDKKFSGWLVSETTILLFSNHTVFG